MTIVISMMKMRRVGYARRRTSVLLRAAMVAAVAMLSLPAYAGAERAAAARAAAAPAPPSKETAATAGKASGYKDSIEAWRKERDASLRSEDGWLTVAGLFWLKDGPNRFGTDPSNEIVLPAGSAPRRAGIFEFREGSTIVMMDTIVYAEVNGKGMKTAKLRPDAPGPPDVLALDALTMTVIKRGDRYGIRLKDKNRKERRTFEGTDWFPVDEAFRITAAFTPYDPPRKISITNVLGQTEDQPCPGYASFTIGGKELRLEPVGERDDKELFIIFRDMTSGKETYGAGRFLDAERTEDGRLLLDFNKAYSPPCAYTPYATCPLPPKQNALPVRIEAGEKSKPLAH